MKSYKNVNPVSGKFTCQCTCPHRSACGQMLTNHSTVVAPGRVSLRTMGLKNKLRKILNGSNLILRSQNNSMLYGGKTLNQEA